MATYTCDLNEGKIYIKNQGEQTVITLVSGGETQQQSQSNSFATGKWRVPPSVFKTGSSIVLRVEAEGVHFMQVQTNRMSKLNSEPSLSDADVLPLQKVNEAASEQPMKPMQPMSPMQPMPPMQMDDMQMQMGNMEMRMGEPLLPLVAPEQRQSGKNFCPQCGSKVGKSDRFCSNCGTALE